MGGTAQASSSLDRAGNGPAGVRYKVPMQAGVWQLHQGVPDPQVPEPCPVHELQQELPMPRGNKDRACAWGCCIQIHPVHPRLCNTHNTRLQDSLQKGVAVRSTSVQMPQVCRGMVDSKQCCSKLTCSPPRQCSRANSICCRIKICVASTLRTACSRRRLKDHLRRWRCHPRTCAAAGGRVRRHS